MALELLGLYPSHVADLQHDLDALVESTSKDKESSIAFPG